MKTAIAVMGWNRADHLANLLTSLERNGSKHDLWIFIDGPRAGCSNEQRQRVNQCVELADLEPTANVVTAYMNGGPSKSLLSQMDYLFSKGYARVIQFCDDLLLSPHYVANVDHMLDVFEKDQRVGAVSAFGSRKHPDHDPYLDCYTSMANMIGMATWHDRWQQYAEEAGRLCLEAKEGWEDKRKLFEEMYGSGIPQDISLSCDGLLYCSMLKRNQMPVSTVANCLRHVGVHGEFTTPVTYKNLGWSEMPFCKEKIKIKHPGKSFFEDAIPKLKQQYGIS